MEDTKMPQTGVNFINRKGTKVLAYSDTVIFYNGKGNGKIESQDKIDPSSEKAPFGLIKTGNNQPFQVEFDSSNSAIYLNPGMLSVYGRQVQIKERIKVHGFRQDSLASKNYCTLYIEINLSDILNQTVRVVLTSSANGYEYDYGVNGSNRDNLYKYNNGIYRVPIAQFKFIPMDSNPFSDLKYLIQDFDMSARESTRNLREDATITGRKIIGDLAKKELHPYEDDLRFLVKADNQEALNSYENEKVHNRYSPGYSWAKESRSFGGVRIGSDLSNLITISRVKICDITNNFGRKAFSGTSINTKIDWNHLKAVNIFMARADSLKLTCKYYSKKVSTFGAISYINLNPFDSNANGSRLTIIEKNYLVKKRENKNKIKMSLVGFFGGFEHVYNAKDYEVNLDFYDATDADISDTDAFQALIPGVDIVSAWVHAGRRKYMDMLIENNRIEFTGYGDSAEQSQYIGISLIGPIPGPNYIWWGYPELEVNNATGALYADFIYQGDVNI